MVHLSGTALGDGTWDIAHKRNTILCNVVCTRHAWRMTSCAGELGKVTLVARCQSFKYQGRQWQEGTCNLIRLTYSDCLQVAPASLN